MADKATEECHRSQKLRAAIAGHGRYGLQPLQNLFEKNRKKDQTDKILDEIFNIQYKNKNKDIYQLLNTSFHDSVYLCIRDLLKNLDSEVRASFQLADEWCS